MIITITLILSFLVALNFLLLTFSCNKVTRKADVENQLIITTQKPIKATKHLATNQLAPTGS